MVIQMWLTTPGPCKSASTVVSPGMGRLLSSFEFQSGLLDDERRAIKSFGCVRANGSDKCQLAGRWQLVKGMNINASSKSLIRRKIDLFSGAITDVFLPFYPLIEIVCFDDV